jgi:hypothetical protein
MKLDERQQKKLRSLAKSSAAEYLYEFLELVKADVADVRTKMNVRSEVEKEVRLGVCDVIDDLIVNTIKRFGTETEIGKSDYT